MVAFGRLSGARLDLRGSCRLAHFLTVDAVVIPATACGSSAVLSLRQSQAQIITVAENQTTMQVPPAPLGIKAIAVNSYLEAIGVMAAHKAGVNPTVLCGAIANLHCLSTTDD